MIQDLKFALRTLTKSPGVTPSAILALGLGLGASTAILSVLDRVLLRPLPFPQSDRIVNLGAIAADLAEQYPDINKGEGAAVNRLLDDTVGAVRPGLLMLLAGVGLGRSSPARTSRTSCSRRR